LIVNGHLDEDREIDRLERDDGGEDKKHAIKGDEAEKDCHEAPQKGECVENDRHGRTDGAGDLERRLLHGGFRHAGIVPLPPT